MTYPRPPFLSLLRFSLLFLALSIAPAVLASPGELNKEIAPLLLAPHSSDPGYSKNDIAPTGGIWVDVRPASLPGGLDNTFRPDIWAAPGTVRTSAVQADGKLVLGGFFRTLNGESRNGVVRLNADNSIDGSFNVSVLGSVAAVAIQSDGKIVIGGFFTAVNGVGRHRVARLNIDGSLDTSFDVGSGTDNAVNDLLIQPDGKIVIAGSFFGFRDAASPHIVRLNPDGTRDPSFSSPIAIWPPSVTPSVCSADARTI